MSGKNILGKCGGEVPLYDSQACPVETITLYSRLMWSADECSYDYDVSGSYVLRRRHDLPVDIETGEFDASQLADDEFVVVSNNCCDGCSDVFVFGQKVSSECTIDTIEAAVDPDQCGVTAASGSYSRNCDGEPGPNDPPNSGECEMRFAFLRTNTYEPSLDEDYYTFEVDFEAWLYDTTFKNKYIIGSPFSYLKPLYDCSSDVMGVYEIAYSQDTYPVFNFVMSVTFA